MTGRAPSAATRPVSWLRLVTTHQAAGRAGQQRPDLLGVAGVVQHDQHPPAGEQAAVQRGLRVAGRPGSARAATPSASRKPRSASAGVIGARAAGSKPRRFT